MTYLTTLQYYAEPGMWFFMRQAFIAVSELLKEQVDQVEKEMVRSTLCWFSLVECRR